MPSWQEIMAGPGNVSGGESPDTTTTTQPPPAPERPMGRANRLAVTALILSCVAPFLVGGVLATVLGTVALDEIEESEGKERGAAMARWAIALGFVNILVSCAVFVFVVLVLTH